MRIIVERKETPMCVNRKIVIGDTTITTHSKKQAEHLIALGGTVEHCDCMEISNVIKMPTVRKPRRRPRGGKK